MSSLKDAKVDPLKECIAAYETTSVADVQADNHSKGILIFFHGSPCEGLRSIIVLIGACILSLPLH